VRKVWVFFYGSFMSPAVLAKADVRPTDLQKARLDGWELTIAPRATLMPAPGRSVHGILARLTHAELGQLYGKDFFGFGTYLPEAVLVTPASGNPLPGVRHPRRRSARNTASTSPTSITIAWPNSPSPLWLER